MIPDDERRLEDTVREAAQAHLQSTHERVAQGLRGFAATANDTGRVTVYLDDPRPVVAAWVNKWTGQPLGPRPTWVRVIRNDIGRGALFVVSSPHPCGQADLLVAADRGVIDRGVIRGVCRWAFYGLGLWRIVVHIPANRPDLSDLARRARFRFEGTSHLFFGGVLDAHLWAMTGPDCPWLTSPLSAIPIIDVSPPASMKVH